MNAPNPQTRADSWNPHGRSDSRHAMIVRNPFSERRGEPTPAMVGALVGDRYRVLAELGRGGMAEVYLAEHVQMRKRVAIKVLQQRLCNRVEFRDRFIREARATAHLDHENVVQVTDCGETAHGSVFLVMELLEGEELSRTIARDGAMPVARIKHIGAQVCEAVQAAHDAGVLHRDIKPDNCFRLARSGDPDFIKVLDFGLAKIARESEFSEGETTAPGTVLGTPAYMPPEQCNGAQTDVRSDVYAIGVLLYELATGSRPFSGPTAADIMIKQLTASPPSPREVAPSVSVELEALLLKAISKHPADRFQSVAVLASALARMPERTAKV